MVSGGLGAASTPERFPAAFSNSALDGRYSDRSMWIGMDGSQVRELFDAMGALVPVHYVHWKRS